MNIFKQSVLIIFLIIALIIAWYFFFKRADKYQSDHFFILNFSNASYFELKQLSVNLEKERSRICNYLNQIDCNEHISVILSEGREIPNAIGGLLRLYRFDGRIDDRLIIHELTHIIIPHIRLPSTSEGLSVYVDELLSDDISRKFPFFGQSVSSWMALFIEKNRIITLNKLLSIKTFGDKFDLGGSVSDAFAWQAYIESSSLIRWIIETWGWDSFWEYSDSSKLVPLFGSSIEEIEKNWIQYEKNRVAPFMECQKLLDQSKPRFRIWCSVLNGMDGH